MPPSNTSLPGLMRNREVEEETRLHFQESFPNHRIGDLPLQTWGLKIEDDEDDDHDEDDEDDKGDDEDDEDDECDDDAITDLSQGEGTENGYKRDLIASASSS